MVVDAAELVGVTVFALSGGLLAARRGMDLFGAVVLALVAGLGGGTIRDVLLGATPPSNLSDVAAVTCAATAGAVAFVTTKSGWTSSARSTNNATAAYSVSG